MLSQNKTITYLDLCSTKIGDEGALSMIDALEGNTSLTRLGLSNNLISETGGMLLADMLDRNGSIHHLHIAANQVPTTCSVVARAASPTRGCCCILARVLKTICVSAATDMPVNARQVSHTSLLRIMNGCKRRKAAASSQEPRALHEQIKVLKKMEQKILETEFRIARAITAREDAQRQAQEEKDRLTAAQNESRRAVPPPCALHTDTHHRCLHHPELGVDEG